LSDVSEEEENKLLFQLTVSVREKHAPSMDRKHHTPSSVAEGVDLDQHWAMEHASLIAKLLYLAANRKANMCLV
jgi:hypothetical protein